MSMLIVDLDAYYEEIEKTLGIIISYRKGNQITLQGLRKEVNL